MDPTPAPNSSDAGRRPRLLIADDDAVVRSALSMQLASVFDLVTPACDAAEAVAFAAEHQPDVAIVDVEMPAGGGVEAARGIAACSPTTAIVALSVDESRAVVLEMLEAGAVTYVRKGISGSQLVSTLLHCIEAGGRS
jgi:DNA-binding NarL/FixJ family response regulator